MLDSLDICYKYTAHQEIFMHSYFPENGNTLLDCLQYCLFPFCMFLVAYNKFVGLVIF